MPIFSADTLREVAVRILRAVPIPDEEALIVADLLVDSNLAGHDSHGILRLPQYLGMVRDGAILPGAPLKVLQETPATAVLDGGWGFGQVVARGAMDLTVRKARTSAVGAVAVRHCNHIGRLGAYAALPCEAGMVGLLFVNGHAGDQGVAPYGGIARRLGTNPFAVAVPSAQGPPVVLDITTSIVAGGKIRLARARGEPVPEGCLIDAEGRPTTDPNVYYDPPRGALLPFGGHKGYGLSVMIDLLVGTLSGAGASAPDAPRSGNALLTVAVDIERFVPLDAFREEVRQFIAYLKTSPKAPGVAEILAPGERAFRERERRLREGIEVEDRTWGQILDAARRLGVEL
ncbi:Ldh family oxidoreductase [bacterium]|nr:Ldh family oxidoreductase [bacterium]